MSQCPCCASMLVRGIKDWHLRCRSCSYEGSALEPKILERSARDKLDEGYREAALRPLRMANFEILAERLARLPLLKSSPRGRLLDVGCAHGWFLERMSEYHDVKGIEPDPSIADVARRRGLDVDCGFFPDAAGSDVYDLIAFNDVLEHIPDARGTLDACHERLAAGGYVVINAPDRRGFLYRLAKLMAHMGMGGAFDRMWQVGFPSPHLHYFDTQSVRALANSAGMSVVDTFSMPTATFSGLYSRIRYDKSVPAVKAGALTAMVALAIPALAILPSDIRVWILRKV